MNVQSVIFIFLLLICLQVIRMPSWVKVTANVSRRRASVRRNNSNNYSRDCCCRNCDYGALITYQALYYFSTTYKHTPIHTHIYVHLSICKVNKNRKKKNKYENNNNPGYTRGCVNVVCCLKFPNLPPLRGTHSI